MGIIYKATNLKNGKVYIGQTSRCLDARIKEHLNCKNNYMFSNSLQKHGIENFQFEILECTDDLCEQEKFYIKKFDSFKTGYNMTEGGEISPMIYPNIAKRVGESKKGKPSWSKGISRPYMKGDKNPAKRKDVRKKISESKMGSLNPNYGKKLKFSEERNNKIRKKLTGRKFSEEHKNNISIAAKKRSDLKRDKKGRYVKRGKI